MIALSTVRDALGAVATARTVSASAYLLYPGALMRALESACHAHARVCVRIESAPYRDAAAARENAAEGKRLRELGAEVTFARGLHAKAIVADGVVYLDDRNWAGADDTVLRDDVAADVRLLGDGTMLKTDALAGEAQLLQSTNGDDDVVIESEAFGYDKQIFPALQQLAREGRHVRLLVAARELHRSPQEGNAIASLQALGVEVRTSEANEKFALAGERAWIGSANATYATPEQHEWGLRTNAPDIVTHLRAAFESRWSVAKPVKKTATG
jgi:hypothetical protein